MKERKFHIRCDMEGVTGVVNRAQVTPGAPEYHEARSWFMAELLALIEGLIAGGATDVSVYDEHWFGRNIDLSRIPKGVRVFCGKPPYRSDWAGGLDESHAGLILHGLHSMEGAGQTLSHTYEPDFTAISINGTAVGEIGVEAAIAGDWGVPLALVIADSAGAEEALKLIPGARAVATKISRGTDGAECFSLVDNIARIREAASSVARESTPAVPWRVAQPVEMFLSFRNGRYLDRLREHASPAFVSPTTLRLTGPSVTAVWAGYWQQKLQVERLLAGTS